MWNPRRPNLLLTNGARNPIPTPKGTSPPRNRSTTPNSGALARLTAHSDSTRPLARHLHDLLRDVSVVQMQGPRERRWRWKR